MKEVLAAVGIAAIVIIGYSVIKNKVGTKGDCGCGCGGNCEEGKEHDHKHDHEEHKEQGCGCGGNTKQPQMGLLVPMNNMGCNENGLGENWIKDFDTNFHSYTDTVTRK